MPTDTTEPQVTSPSRRRSPWPWVIAAAVLVVAAVAIPLLTTGHAGDGEPEAAAPSTPSRAGGQDSGQDSGGDLRTPEAAARSFLAAARTGSGARLVALSCVGRPACVREHAASATEAELTEVRDAISEGVFELAVHLEGAEFAAAVDGAEPGTRDVPYRTPAMTGDAYLTLTFVRSGDDWLYHRPTS